MALILDHINGVSNDNRLENLRIVCPNCAATLDTHSGRKNRIEREPRECRHCGGDFLPRYDAQRYCSRDCGVHHDRGRHTPKPQTRKVERPSYEQLLGDVQSMSLLAVSRKYGVSDKAVRKWLRWYEHQAERERSGGTADDDGLDQAA
jgi:ribosomal protein S27AE